VASALKVALGTPVREPYRRWHETSAMLMAAEVKKSAEVVKLAKTS
jgi:hypothetical protein